jgi:hypothetical protein
MLTGDSSISGRSVHQAINEKETVAQCSSERVNIGMNHG